MDSSIIVLIILAIAFILFITELFPIPVTSMGIIILLYFLKIIDSDTAFRSFSSNTVIIIAALSIIGESIFETGGGHTLGKLLIKISKNERNLVFIIVLFSGIISGFLSNTGAAALLINFVLIISSTNNLNRSKLIYPVIVGCSLGGGLTIVGTTSGPFLKETYDSLNLGSTLHFFEFAPLSIILLIVGAIYLYLIGYNLLPDKPKNTYVNNIKIIQKNNCSKKYVSFIILSFTLIMMILEPIIKIPCHFIALIGALGVIITKCISFDKGLKAIPLKGIILYATMVPLGEALINSGATTLIVEYSLKLFNKISNPFIIIVIIFLIITPITNFMSNAATIILFTPIVITIAQGLNLNIKPLLIALRFAASIAIATPIATPPNTMALEPGGYSFKDFLVVGLPLAIIEIIVSIIYIFTVYKIN